VLFCQNYTPAIVLSGDFENLSVVFSSVALAAICQGRKAYDKTMLAANAAAPPRRYYGLHSTSQSLHHDFRYGGALRSPISQPQPNRKANPSANSGLAFWYEFFVATLEF
jgi:hypothetical protein